MILAAGLGTRLRPLTDHTPKALIPVGGVPILERVADRLIAAGADRLIINLHHLGDRIRSYVREREGFGVEVVYSEEIGTALETGGGLLHASHLFRRDRPFFLHNADILTDVPLRSMYDSHESSGAIATLAAMERRSSRHLLFDEAGLMGRVDHGKELRLESRKPLGGVTELGFAGIHVISPELLDLITETGGFSILDTYLRLAREGMTIRPYRVDTSHWIDIGKPDQLAAADRWLERSLPDSVVEQHADQGKGGVG
ncbi:nucleotidyltransferase family protein [soil metagenome]